MSVEATAAVWAMRGLTSTEKLVAVRLADHAHPDGTNARPSVGRLSADTGLSERAVQGALLRLVEKGVTSKADKRHSSGCHVYRVNMDWQPPHDVHPAAGAPPQEMHPAGDAGGQDVHPDPAGDAPPPPHDVHPTPAAGAPEPSRTVKGTALEPSVAALAHRTGKVDLLFDAVVDACEMDPHGITSSARGALNKALKDLRAVGAAPTAIASRAAAYRDKYPDLTLTPTALAKHWPQLDPSKQKPRRQTSAPTGRSLSAIDNARQKQR